MSRNINVGGIVIGGGGEISIQSMCNTDTRNIEATVNQIEALALAGCQIVRVAVPDMEAARAIREIKCRTAVPLVADIHFDYRLALESLENGADKLRINPGNIGPAENTRAVAAACAERGVPIRVGVNGGSLSREIIARFGTGPAALCQSAVENVQVLEACGFEDICVSLKASNVFDTVKAYRLFRELRDYPLHLGVTEAGSRHMGTVKSAAAFGALLCDGIGDTIRVSLTADPVEEVIAAKDILQSLGLNKTGVTVISCPTCGRTGVDLISLAGQVEERLKNIKAKLSVAVMGCAVNGPGEARQADIGIACGKGEGLIIRKGEILCKVPEDELVPRLIQEIEAITGEKI